MTTDPKNVAAQAAETITNTAHDVADAAAHTVKTVGANLADAVDGLRHNDTVTVTVTVTDIWDTVTAFRRDHPTLAVAAAGLLAVTVLGVIIRCARR
jgi:hypothetical protein